MVTLRCTARLLRRLGASDSDAPPSGQLGDWYANVVATRPRHLVLCTNARTLLCVVVPLAPQAKLTERFVTAARARLTQIPVVPALLLAEMEALTDVHFGRASNRSVLGSMREFGYAVKSWLKTRSADDLDALGLWLCDTPCSPLETHWPWLEAELVLAGSVEPGRRPLKFLAHVI